MDLMDLALGSTAAPQDVEPARRRVRVRDRADAAARSPCRPDPRRQSGRLHPARLRPRAAAADQGQHAACGPTARADRVHAGRARQGRVLDQRADAASRHGANAQARICRLPRAGRRPLAGAAHHERPRCAPPPLCRCGGRRPHARRDRDLAAGRARVPGYRTRKPVDPARRRRRHLRRQRRGQDHLRQSGGRTHAGLGRGRTGRQGNPPDRPSHPS